MHNAPAVNFPVGRSRFYGLALIVAGLLGAGLCGFWVLASPALPNWRAPLAGACVALTWTLAAVTWWRSPVGTLRWSGEQWEFAPARQPPLVFCGDLGVHLDLQFLMVVLFKPQNGLFSGTSGHPMPQHPMWLWLDANAGPHHWLALRRAAHARVWQPKPEVGQPETQMRPAKVPA